ncbi:MAG: glycosyltransferase [Nitrospirae bacterium]|nr:glycosyltransferase [Nitrospirota bacterium]
MPLVTVLMGVHNGEKFLVESIESLFRQTLSDFEIVIVDDGSTDSTPRLLETLARQDDRVKLLQNSRKMGLAASLNKGLSVARGEFVARQDVDDLSLPERIGVQVSYLKSHPEIGVAGCDHYLIDETGAILELVRPFRTDTEIRWGMLFANTMSHPTVMYRRHLAPVGAPFYNEAVRYCDDYELWFRLLRKTRFANVSVPLCLCRVHCGQLSEFHARGGGRNLEAAGVALAAWQELVPGSNVTREDLSTIRRWHGHLPRRLAPRDRPRAEIMLRAFESFLHRETVDPDAAAGIREKWITPLVGLMCRGETLPHPSNGLPCQEDPWSRTLRVRRLRQMARDRLGRVKRHVLGRLGAGTPSRPILGYRAACAGSPGRRALMTFLTEPFRQSPEQVRASSHTFTVQALEIARAFNRLGYSVDVADWLDGTFVPQVPYDAYFGMHVNFERMLPYLPPRCVKIYYGTGEYWADEKAAIQERARGLMSRRGILIPHRIPLDFNTWVEQADAVVVLGNETTSSGYRSHHPHVHLLDNNTIVERESSLSEKNFHAARKHFLMLCGNGLLRRGVDLALEAFAAQPEHHLWVCGMFQVDHDIPFVKAFRRELFHTPNIHPVGWVDIHSETFLELTRRCAFVLYPTATEGISGAVLSAMGKGLIPIVSPKTGVDVNPFGIVMNECSVAEIEEQVRTLAGTDPERLRDRAREAHERAHTRYSLASFRKNIESILKTILARHGQTTG